jgi:Protein of unknown function (DUF732)
MANRERRPADPTVAASLDGRTVAAPVDGGQTTAVPNTRPTDKVELAWSTGDVLGGEEIPENVREEKPQPAVASQSWSATLRIAGLLLAGGLVLAGAIFLGRWVLTSEKSSDNAGPTPGATSATSAPETSAAPVSIASTPDTDNSYMQALNEKGMAGLEPDKAIATGKQVCQDMYKGVKLATEIGAFREQQRNAGSFLADHAEDFVNTSIHAYCPQFGG